MIQPIKALLYTTALITLCKSNNLDRELLGSEEFEICVADLNKSDETNDGVLNQQEFVQFILETVNAGEVGEHDMKFEDLSLELIMAFNAAACEPCDGQADDPEVFSSCCNGQSGISLNDDNIVRELCRKVYNRIDDIFPSVSPSVVPTSSPTGAVTDVPTKSPTMSPSKAPVAATMSPSVSPSNADDCKFTVEFLYPLQTSSDITASNLLSSAVATKLIASTEDVILTSFSSSSTTSRRRLITLTTAADRQLQTNVYYDPSVRPTIDNAIDTECGPDAKQTEAGKSSSSCAIISSTVTLFGSCDNNAEVLESQVASIMLSSIRDGSFLASLQ